MKKLLLLFLVTLFSCTEESVTPVVSSVEKAQVAWNLQIFPSGENSTYQIINDNLNTGVVVIDKVTKIRYKLVNKGPIVGPLLTNYEED